MNHDLSRNSLRLPLVAPLAIIEPAIPEVIPGGVDRSPLPVPYGQPNVDATGSTDAEVSVPDPYEVAYLRGGGREVLRLYLFDLVQRGYLRLVPIEKWFSTEYRLAASPNAPPFDELTGIEQAIVSWFETPLGASDIGTLHTSEPVKSLSERLRAELEAKGQLASAAPKGARTAILIAGGLALYVFVNAGRWYIGALIVVAAVVIANTSLGRRRLKGGRQRLKNLEAAFARLKDDPRTAKLGVADPALVTAVAVFGTAILVGSPYDAFAAAVGPSAAAGWSFGFGSGCDGGCDGDGDGGCGGCCG